MFDPYARVKDVQEREDFLNQHYDRLPRLANNSLKVIQKNKKIAGINAKNFGSNAVLRDFIERLDQK